MTHPPLQLLLCQRLFPEAKAAMAEQPLPGLDIRCLPRSCTPRQDELESLLREAGHLEAPPGGTLLLGGGCLAAQHGSSQPPGLQVACRSTCFSYFLPTGQVEALLRRRAYLVTPGWLSGWRAVLTDWGLGEAEARAAFAESCLSIVLLDTGVDAGAVDHLQAFAAYVGLPAERISVGLGHFREALLEEAWTAREAQVASLMDQQKQQIKQARRRIAEQAALLDIVHEVAGTLDEAAIVQKLLALTQLLFAPARSVWIPHWKAQWGEALWLPMGSSCSALETELRSCAPGIHPSGTGDGLLMHFEGTDGTMGLLGVSGLALPGQLPSYLDTARTLVEAGLLALGNARNLHGMIKICAWCRKVKDDERGWGTFEDYLHHQSSASFSHGMCPTCAEQMQQQISGDHPGRST